MIIWSTVSQCQHHLQSSRCEGVHMHQSINHSQFIIIVYFCQSPYLIIMNPPESWVEEGYSTSPYSRSQNLKKTGFKRICTIFYFIKIPKPEEKTSIKPIYTISHFNEIPEHDETNLLTNLLCLCIYLGCYLTGHLCCLQRHSTCVRWVAVNTGNLKLILW